MKFIAEFCQNHNGDFDTLVDMIEQASMAGATHGKMQTIYSDNLTFRPEFEHGVMTDGKVAAIKRPYDQEYNRLKGLEISQDQSAKFVEICKKNNLIPMTTCFARSNMNEIIKAGFTSIKIASYDCGSYQMIRELKNNFQEITISTGASYNNEIEYASKILKGSNFAILHCVTQYPTPLSEMNLARMQWLSKFSKDYGLSDHSNVSEDGVWACKVAIYLGAKILERHFTILPSDQTRDGPVSITPNHLREIMDFSNLDSQKQLKHLDTNYENWKVMIGSEQRNMSHEELLNRNYYKGRFASHISREHGNQVIYNWEEIPL